MSASPPLPPSVLSTPAILDGVRRGPSSGEPRTTTQQQRPAPLWLACRLPKLALEVLELAADTTTATVQRLNGRPEIAQATAAAEQAGIRPGMPLEAAYALCSTLQVCSRNLQAEASVRQQVADWALQFSPWVSLDHAPLVLVEIGASLRLFNGLEALTQAFSSGVRRLGLQLDVGVAPTPKGAALLAQHRPGSHCLGPDSLHRTLRTIPLHALSLSGSIRARLHQAGMHQLQDLWRLPRGDLGRRYGAALLRELDELEGRRGTPLRRFHQPPRFNARQELPTGMRNYHRFFPAIEALLLQLQQFLHQQDALAGALDFQLHHAQGASPLRVGLRQPNRDAHHCAALTQEHLARMQLPAAVIDIELTVTDLRPFAATSCQLFADQEAAPTQPTHTRAFPEALAGLLERIEARLGPNVSTTLALQEDHRPECAWVANRLRPDPAAVADSPRPLWLLPEPEPIDIAPLQLDPDIERIESGWWDNQPVRRDYRRAWSATGIRYWIFREAGAPNQWYLHGLFG